MSSSEQKKLGDYWVVGRQAGIATIEIVVEALLCDGIDWGSGRANPLHNGFNP